VVRWDNTWGAGCRNHQLGVISDRYHAQLFGPLLGTPPCHTQNPQSRRHPTPIQGTVKRMGGIERRLLCKVCCVISRRWCGGLETEAPFLDGVTCQQQPGKPWPTPPRSWDQSLGGGAFVAEDCQGEFKVYTVRLRRTHEVTNKLPVVRLGAPPAWPNYPLVARSGTRRPK